MCMRWTKFPPLFLQFSSVKGIAKCTAVRPHTNPRYFIEPMPQITQNLDLLKTDSQQQFKSRIFKRSKYTIT